MSQQTPESDGSDDFAAAFAAAVAFRSASLRIRARYLREFLQLFPILSQERDLQRWLQLNVALVRRWQVPVRSLALEFVQQQADLQGVPRPPASRLVRMPDEQIVSGLVSRGPVVARKARLVGLDELEAWERAEAAAAGKGGKLVLDEGRKAIEQQRTALGWMRVSDGDPCYWCAMLVSRGSVYGSEGAAGADQNERFIGEGLHKYHDFCGCTALPIYRRTDFMSAEALEFRSLWDEVYPSGGLTGWRREYEKRRKAAAGASTAS